MRLNHSFGNTSIERSNAIMEYQKLTVKMALELAAPHTWPAAVMPVVIGIALSIANEAFPSWITCLVLLFICVLMQSSVNTFNDYFDYAKGLDSTEDNLDPTDAVLLYNNVNPKSALKLAIGFLAAAFVLGIYIIWLAGWIPLVIALVGALIVVLYSAGKTPISSLPIGEAVSGIVMGGLITLAVFDVLVGEFSWFVLLWSIPQIIGIGLIMMTNNTCDIEKDVQSNRRTLPIILGRKRARKVYHALLWSWIASIVIIVAIWFTDGLVIVVCMLLTAIPLVKPLLANPLKQSSRIKAMGQICSVNIALGAFYAASILFFAAQFFGSLLP